jgi:predicted nucleotidyltransferase
MARRLVRRFDPEQIILFGSQARGTAGPDSDVDLLVVMPVKRAKKADTEIEMGVVLHDILVPMDIIVVTPDEVERRRHIPGTIIRPALLEGKVLYARRRSGTGGGGTAVDTEGRE